MVKLETLKSYIKTHLKTRFIQHFKSLASILILFNQKLNSRLYFYVNYSNLNNLTPKNYDLSFLIKKALDRLGLAKHFILLYLTNTHHQIRIQKSINSRSSFRPYMIILNIRLCFSDFLIFRQVFKAILIS